jgi:putative peptide zinc metalloprotease protein
MPESLFSPSWYRVSKLKPRLRGHAHIYRHDYRGEVWYVMQDHAKGRYYRFAPTAYHFIGQMDGERDIQELWERTAERFGDDAPTQNDIVHLLGQLHAADVLLSDVPPDTAELLRRSEKIETQRRLMNFRSPLALRFPLVDPEKFLARTVRLVRPLFGVVGALIWLAVVGSAVVLAGVHWPELSRDVVDRVLTAQNLFILWLTYPVVKVLHELGHGYAVKSWGGEVHEMGVMLLVLMPVPYVDASAASEFRAKHRRVIVGAAGILVELFLASLALFLWLNLQPGTLRSMAYNVVLIGSVSTLLFNANPLLRFDGYYIFSDLVDIPNLAQRGLQYLGYAFKRYLFGVEHLEAPHTAPGERFWFVVYSLAAFVYRLFVYFAIVLFIAGKFFFIGIVLALWAAVSMVVSPLFKGARFLAASPQLREKRTRAVLWIAGLAALAFLILFVLPFPSSTVTEGVVWAPEDSTVRVGTDGFVGRVVALPGTRVQRGDLLIENEDPFLAARVEVVRARLGELESRHDSARASDAVQARIVAEELESVRRELQHAEERVGDLAIRSPADGVFILPGARDLPGRYLRHGQAVGYVVEVTRPTIRVVVPQKKVDLVRQRTRSVEVRFAERVGDPGEARIMREVPEAEEDLPSTTLGAAGGGSIAVDPQEASGTRTFETLFQFDLELLEPVQQVFIGGRVHVRFDHGYEPIAFQAYRSLRQLFLRRFRV